MPKENENFGKLAEFFRSKAEPVSEVSTEQLLDLLDKDLSVGFPYPDIPADTVEDLLRSIKFIKISKRKR